MSNNTTHQLNIDKSNITDYNDDEKFTADNSIGINTLSHLTIKQIISAPEPENINQEKILKIDNKVVNQVMICGTIMEINHTQTLTNMTISDKSASIKIQFWTSNGDQLQNKLLQLKFCTINSLSSCESQTTQQNKQFKDKYNRRNNWKN